MGKVILFLLISVKLFAIEGIVRDLTENRISNARILFVQKDDTSKKYSFVSDINGIYTGDIPLVKTSAENNAILFPTYPNPSCGGAVISFFQLKEGTTQIIIYNLLGEAIIVLTDRNYNAGIFQLLWNGRYSDGQRCPDGMYLVRMLWTDGNEKSVSTTKLILAGDCDFTPMLGYLPDQQSTYDTIGIHYQIIVSRDSFETYIIEDTVLVNVNILNFTLYRKSAVPYACTGNYLGIWNGKDYTPIFIKGINLGVSKPGTSPGELIASNEDYRRWFIRMGELGFNLIRVYTLHYPRFYDELKKYNNLHRDKPLFLIQGIWLDEEYGSEDLFTQSKKFDDDIEEVTDCVHGKRTIGQRFGRAYGVYTNDVNKWVIGYIIGREIYPSEVRETNKNHSSDTFYNGTSVKISEAQPFDSWLTARVDHVITYERSAYKVERPVSASSWPTLDPIRHPSEKNTEEDTAYSNLDPIQAFNAPAGYFASYHAYPYYPDFISYDAGYRQFSDSFGSNSYLGYITDLKNHYSKRPLVIAEFGVPSSWGNAHFSFSGMNHGGHSEYMQGIYDLRLISNIYDANCGGGILFSWIDEWFKRTWIVDPISTQGERRNLWHNITSPEQNFGLINFSAIPAKYKSLSLDNSACTVNKISAAFDYTFFYLDITLKAQLNTLDTIYISFDTYRKDLGESILPNGDKITNRAEFVLKLIPNKSADLYVAQAYDLFGIWHKESQPYQLYHSIATNGKPWNLIRWKNNFYDTSIYYAGELHSADEKNDTSSLNAVIWGSKSIKIKIPWTLIQFTDPSQMEVMDDNRSTPEREVIVSDGISVGVDINHCVVQSERFTWPVWNLVPPDTYNEVEKPAALIYSKALKVLPDLIK